jgi:hypothetical protein
MPPGNGAALQKVFTSLGLCDIFQEISADVADSSRTTGRSGPATAGSGGSAPQRSSVDMTAAVPEVAAHELLRHEGSYSCDGFGSDLQPWNSHAETEMSYNNPGHKGPSPYTLDTSPFEEVFGACMETDKSGGAGPPQRQLAVIRKLLSTVLGSHVQRIAAPIVLLLSTAICGHRHKTDRKTATSSTLSSIGLCFPSKI